MIVSSAYISAVAALCGSIIGALVSIATTWLSQHHQDESRRRAQKYTRRERIFIEFIDLSSKAFVDALLETSIKDPAKVVSLYATIGKLRLFASVQTVEAADKVMSKSLKPTMARESIFRPGPPHPIRPISFANSLRDVAPNYVPTTIENRGPNG